MLSDLFGDPSVLISRMLTLVIAFTIHEFAHAWTATRLGDETPRMAGRLTLNPLAHLDPLGTLMLLFAGFGWARPVPVDPYRLGRRSPAGLMLVSLAGPMSNFIMAIIAAIPLRLHLASAQSPVAYLPSSRDFLIEFMFINLLLMLFNLIPLAPLDGDKIADYFFPPSWGRVLQTIRPYGPIILLAILFLGPRMGVDIFGTLIYPPIMNLARLLLGSSLLSL